jgi:hypothetical protein
MDDWQADFAVFSEDGQLAVIAEAKKKTGTDQTWATAWFRNYLDRQRSAAPRFVLLATPERLYLWKGPAETSAPEPTAVADARRIFSSYLQRPNLDPAALSSRTFEFIVGAWLDDLSHHLWRPSAPEEISALVETGLLEAVENGRVVAAVAA